jgi:hypothetical protein
MGTEGRTDGQLDRQADGQRYMTKLIVAFRNFVNAPIKNGQQDFKFEQENVIIWNGYRQNLNIQFHHFYEQTNENHVFP